MTKKSLTTISTLAIATVLICSNVAFAQGGNETTGGDGGGTTTTRNDERDDDGPDMGWLGLLGLAGLAGLLKKPEKHVVRQTDAPRPPAPTR